MKDGASLQTTRHRELFPAQAHFVAFWLHGRAANGGPVPGKAVFCVRCSFGGRTFSLAAQGEGFDQTFSKRFRRQMPQTTATALYKILALQKSDFTISNVIIVKTEVFCSNRLKDGASLQATRHRELFPAQAHFVAFWLHGRAANGGPAPGKSLFACIVVRLPFDREISFQGHLPHFVGGSANFVFLPIFRLTSGR